METIVFLAFLSTYVKRDITCEVIQNLLMNSVPTKSETNPDVFSPVQTQQPFPFVSNPPPSISNGSNRPGGIVGPNGYSEIPIIPQVKLTKKRANTYQDMKLILRDKPTTVFCQTCNRNVVSNLKGKKKALY